MPTHEGVIWRETLMRWSIITRISFVHRWLAVAVLICLAVWHLHQDRRGAQVEGLREQILSSFGAGQAASVGVHAVGLLIDWTA